MRLIAAQEGGIPLSENLMEHSVNLDWMIGTISGLENCPLCDGPAGLLTAKLRRGKGNVFYCKQCDLGFLVGGEPTDYNGPYRKNATPDCTTPQQIFDTYKNHQQKRLEIVRPHLGTSILECGASAGQFLSHVEVYRRCAIEPDEACAQFMRNSWEIHKPQPKEQFDTVCAFQVLEHEQFPIRLMREMLDRVKIGGKVFIEVPNLHDPLRSVWKSAAYEDFYFHSDHLWYFSEKSLRMVAEKAGAQNIEIMHTQDYNLLNHLHWLTEGKPQDTCHPGLSPISLPGTHPIARWLSNSLATLNEVYKAKLAATGKTSNLMMVISA